MKSLLIFPSLNLLVSGSSDKIVSFWYHLFLYDSCVYQALNHARSSRDLTSALDGEPLRSAGSITAHTRPVECLDGQDLANGGAELCTGDTMGLIKLWTLTKDAGSPPRWTGTLKSEFNYHRTKISDLHYGNGQLWSGKCSFRPWIQVLFDLLYLYSLDR